MIAAAGITISRDPARPSDLTVVAASPSESVLTAALAAGPPMPSACAWPAPPGQCQPGQAGSGALAGARPTGRPGVGLAELATRVDRPGRGAAPARLGLQLVRSPDRPGFLVGALLYPHLGDAVRMVQDGYATAADIDTAMTAGCGYPRGPLRILDDAGPAVALSVLTAMHERYGDPAFAPPPLLAEHVAAGIGFGP